MNTKEFNFNLPEELIAQTPCERRDRSRMMVVNRERGSIECGHFYDFPDFLRPHDVIVVNDSKVIPARLNGRKETGASIEILLLSKRGTQDTWEVLLRPAKRMNIGTKIFFDEGSWAEPVERLTDKKWLLKFHPTADFMAFLEKCGKAPLPPYIKRGKEDGYRASDLDRYQTIYAHHYGSVAAPTAGLHFSEDVLRRITERDVPITPVTLHVGYGTFLPIVTEKIESHVMEEEFYTIEEESARRINEAGRIIAVGTTSVRTMESSCSKDGTVRSGDGRTDLFIYPGKRFRIVDSMITNFHLPRSSLFLLVCAFAGTELMKKAYSIAIEKRFRFYSYGDCMFIV